MKPKKPALRHVSGGLIGTFADWPGWKDLPTATVVYLKECTPAELAGLKRMTSAQIRALAKRHAKRRRKAVAP